MFSEQFCLYHDQEQATAIWNYFFDVEAENNDKKSARMIIARRFVK